MHQLLHQLWLLKGDTDVPRDVADVGHQMDTGDFNSSALATFGRQEGTDGFWRYYNSALGDFDCQKDTGSLEMLLQCNALAMPVATRGTQIDI